MAGGMPFLGLDISKIKIGRIELHTKEEDDRED